MTPEQFEQFAGSLPERLEYGLTRAVQETLDDGLARARELSSGTVSEAQLRKEDHPYARRHGSPRRDPSIINTQSGDFLAGWVAIGPWTSQADAVEGTIDNNDPKTDLLGPGTRLMFARPLAERLEREMMPVLEDNVARALERELNP